LQILKKVWLVQENGKYVTLGDNEQVSIPVWPEKEFADFLLTDEWKGFTVESMEVHDSIKWLDQLQEDNIKIAGFPKNDLKAVIVDAE
jgi:hypothetical protein